MAAVIIDKMSAAHIDNMVKLERPYMLSGDAILMNNDFCKQDDVLKIEVDKDKDNAMDHWVPENVSEETTHVTETINGRCDAIAGDSNITETGKEISDENCDNKSDVLKFYRGKKIFITGGTGFLGKILLEKLLRSCTGIETIYLLIRVKKGKDGHRRLDDLFMDPIFDRVRTESPKFRHKIVVIPGDCESNDLGISPQDRETLIENVNIIFHAAATVRFDERLRTALAINVKAALHVMKLAKAVKALQSIIHVSTAYSNCHLSRIEEKFYNCPVNCQTLDQLLGRLNDDQIEDILPQILGPWPNTYTLTKALAEKEIRDNCTGLPLAIFRPAIVTSTAEDPIPGWIDNLYGPTGVVAGAATGVLRTLHCDGEISAEIVPVDRVVNCLIVSAAHVAKTAKYQSDPKIFNFVSATENRIKWKDFMKITTAYLHLHPLCGAIWYVALTLNKSSFMNKVYTILLHLLPAILVDAASACFGQKPRLLKAYRKIHKFSAVISYFCNHDIQFCNRNVRHLWRNTSDVDKEIFHFSMSTLSWDKYFSTYMKGVREHLFKETDDNLQMARDRWRRLYYLHQAIKTIFYGVVLYCLWKFISGVFRF